MSRVMFYFDKDCIEKANEKLKEIFAENGISGVCVFTSYSDSNKVPDRKKEWISFNLGNSRPEDLNNKANDIVRNFDWEAAGITGFEEFKEAAEEEVEVDIKMFGLREVPADVVNISVLAGE
jgi:hypothetical protein